MRIRTALVLLAPVVVAGVLVDAQAPAPKFTIDDLIAIKHPTGHQWTPDGSHVWFTYDDGGVNNVWAAAADGKGQPVALTSYPDGQAAAGGFWSKDGQTFFFARGNELLSASVKGGSPVPAWPSAASGTGFTVSPDGTRVAYIVGQAAGGAGGRGAGRGAAPMPAADPGAPRGGPGNTDLMVRAFVSGTDQRIAHLDGSIGAVSWSPDSTKLAYSTTVAGSSDVMVATLAGDVPISIVHGAGPFTAVAWTPDGAHLTYSAGAAGGGGAPTQIHTSPPEIGAKIIFVTNVGGGGGRGTAGGGGANFIVASGGGTPRPMSGTGVAAGGRAGGGRGGGTGWLDGTHQLASTTSNNGKTRTTLSVDVFGKGEPKVLHSETVEKFFSQVNASSGVSPDRRWLMFTADTTGWDQIYVMPTAGGPITQVTTAPGEHWRATWSHDSRRLAWDTNTADTPGDRQIEIATIGDDPSKATIVTVTSGTGTNISPEWSPDDTRILYQHADAQNSADLYVAAAIASAKPIRLTSSMPDAIDKSALVAPQLIHYPGPDGKPVPAWLFVPKNLDRTRQHAAIVWIHPDGVNMNYNGWHPARQEAVYYEFHQYLLQQGYVVIAPDYRGSIGYGRDWRNDVYMDVGGNDAKDARMAATYLKTLGYVDRDRIGVWGLSYGGFFTLLAITQEPDWFRAAVDVAGVVDYKLYYEDPYHGGWTTSRIGTPEENPDVYAKADPMSHVDQIKHPLLILHGTSDTNVPFIESMLLIDRLLKAGKGSLVDFMVYPGELHYFDRSFVVRDAWQRVDAFFGEHLRPEMRSKQ